MDYYSTDIKKIKSNLLLNIADIYWVDIKDKIEKLKHRIAGIGLFNYSKPLIMYLLVSAVRLHLFQDTIHFIF